MASKCFFCKGAAHPATGCEYTGRVLSCGPCTRRFWTWFDKHQGKRGGGKRRDGTRRPVVDFYEIDHE